MVPRTDPDKKRYSGRLAIRLRKLRDEAGLTVEQVAERMVQSGYKVSAPTIYHWENGQRQPQLDAIPALAKALGKPVSEIFPQK